MPDVPIEDVDRATLGNMFCLQGEPSSDSSVTFVQYVAATGVSLQGDVWGGASRPRTCKELIRLVTKPVTYTIDVCHTKT